MRERPSGRFENRVAIVAGGGSSGPGMGNGRAVALRLASEGALVALVDKNGASASATGTLIVEGGYARPLEIVADVSDEHDCDDIVRRVVDKWHRIDVLVNNVGIAGPPGSVVDLTQDDWDAVLSTNVRSAALLSGAAIPSMPRGSAIVNVGSVAAIRATERPAYAASKGAIVSLTIAMAGQHGRDGIRVNCVAPGLVWTPMAQHGQPNSDAELRRRTQRSAFNLLGTEGDAEDVASAIAFLCSEDARWLTGQTIFVDGGMSFMGRPESLSQPAPASMLRSEVSS